MDGHAQVTQTQDGLGEVYIDIRYWGGRGDGYGHGGDNHQPDNATTDHANHANYHPRPLLGSSRSGAGSGSGDGYGNGGDNRQPKNATTTMPTTLMESEDSAWTCTVCAF